MMKILVTGATGFIGIKLIERLSKDNISIVCAVRKTSNKEQINEVSRVEFVDIDDGKKMKEVLKECDCVVHLAGQMGGYGVTYDMFYKTNCTLTQYLLELSKECSINQFLYCSTPGVYGFGKRKCVEEDEYAPRNDYERTKVEAEKSVISICGCSNMNYTIVRPDFVYGPGDIRRIKLYNNIKNKRFILTTNGKSYLHPTYIDDVVEGIALCIGNKKAYNQIFNIAAKDDITSGEYLDIIAKYTGSKILKVNIGRGASVFFASIIDGLSRKLRNKEGFVSKNKIDFLAVDHSSDISKAERVLGYTPKYSCDEGIRKTIEWCKEKKGL